MSTKIHDLAVNVKWYTQALTPPRNRGKSFERRVAELFGGRRTGYIDGYPDVTCNELVIECKRVDEASVRGGWVEQARECSRKWGKPWLVVHARKGSRLSTTTMDTRLALWLLRETGMIDTSQADGDEVA